MTDIYVVRHVLLTCPSVVCDPVTCQTPCYTSLSIDNKLPVNWRTMFRMMCHLTVLYVFLLVETVAATTTCKFISPDTSLRSSYDIGGQVEIIFSNPGEGDIDMFWVDQTMNEVNMGILSSRDEIG